MGKKREPRRIILDTSAVIYARHGHTLMRSAVEDAVRPGIPVISPFVRMEYLRSVVLNLIALYFLIKGSDSVGDALIDWSQKVRQERKLKVVLMTVHQWIVAQEDWQSREVSLRRLGELIVRSVRQLDKQFAPLVPDPLRCQLGRVTFPRQSFSEELLLGFLDRFRAIQTGIPDCDLCRFRKRQQRRLARRGIGLRAEAHRREFVDVPGFLRQAEEWERAAGTQEKEPACRWCERLGDSIIATHVPRRVVLVTADQAFAPFAQLLGLEVQFLPSLSELKRRKIGSESET
jgi:predicted nucleic acid-binding protein